MNAKSTENGGMFTEWNEKEASFFEKDWKSGTIKTCFIFSMYLPRLSMFECKLVGMLIYLNIVNFRLIQHSEHLSPTNFKIKANWIFVKWQIEGKRKGDARKNFLTWCERKQIHNNSYEEWPHIVPFPLHVFIFCRHVEKAPIRATKLYHRL